MLNESATIIYNNTIMGINSKKVVSVSNTTFFQFYIRVESLLYSDRSS